ncbi:MAG: ArnT family glycosyltransferase [Candidatus Binatia bacterium]
MRAQEGDAHRGLSLASWALAGVLSATFVALAVPAIGTIFLDYDEGYLMLDGRFILRGARPFVDFVHHQSPLHLYLLALSGRLFGETLLGFRMLSLLSVAGSGLLLFAWVRPLVGVLPALLAQAVFLFVPAQVHAMSAVAEPPMVFCTLLGVVLLFGGRGRGSAYAAAVALVGALLIKPTALLMVVAAGLSLVYARDWRRLGHFAAAGVVAGVAGLIWILVDSGGIFADILRFQVQRVGTRNVGMWSIESGFAEMRRHLGIATPGQWAVYVFTSFCDFPARYVTIAVLVASLAGLPFWLIRWARGRPALQAFAVLWPAAYLLLNFAAVDFVSAKYFVPYLACAAFLLAGLFGQVQRYVPSTAAAVAAALIGAALVVHFAGVLTRHQDPWYLGRADWITEHHPDAISFSPILFAATGAEPGCGFANPALAYGGFGEVVLDTERTRAFRFTDQRLIDCLRANPQTPMVIDWSFYFFTRPGSPLRVYLEGEGSAQRLFFSPEALKQWDDPVLSMGSNG